MTETLEAQCRTFLLEMNAPQHIIDNKLNLHALILLSLPTTSKKMDQALKKLPAVQASMPRLIMNFCSVFRENSKRTRI